MNLLKFDYNSVQTKLNFVLITLITIILIVFGGYDYLVTKKRMVTELNSIAEKVSDRLSGSMAVAIWDMHKESGIASVKSEMIDSRIYSIVVRDASAEKYFVAMKRDDETWKPIEFEGNIKGDYITIKKEIKKDEEKMGSVEVFLTDKFMYENLRNSLYSLFIKIFILDLFLVISMSLAIKNIITRPFNRILERVRDIVDGNGDLTMRIDYNSQDEIGTLASLFNRFIENLHKMIQDISNNAKTLDDSCSMLAGLSQEMSNGADNMSIKSTGVSSSAEEMSATMNSIAASMEETATNLQMIASSTEEMSATVDEIASNSEKASQITDHAVKQASNASIKVNELGRAAREIDKVTETITEISEQTNLLALNATIEAARAGEAGKGFAVVANEIKELARQTADATQGIKDRIQDIQVTTTGTVSEIEQISGVINSVNEIVSSIASAVDEQSATTREIAGNVSQASQGMNEVNKNVAQTSSVSGEIAQDVENVNKLANDMSNSSSQVRLSIDELNNMVAGLKQMVSMFKV